MLHRHTLVTEILDLYLWGRSWFPFVFFQDPRESILFVGAGAPASMRAKQSEMYLQGG